MAERVARRGTEEGSAQRSVPMGAGLVVRRHFTAPDRDPFDGVQWERRSAVIQDEKGKVVFEQHEVEIPAFWSQLAATWWFPSTSAALSAARTASRASVR